MIRGSATTVVMFEEQSVEVTNLSNLTMSGAAVSGMSTLNCRESPEGQQQPAQAKFVAFAPIETCSATRRPVFKEWSARQNQPLTSPVPSQRSFQDTINLSTGIQTMPSTHSVKVRIRSRR